MPWTLQNGLWGSDPASGVLACPMRSPLAVGGMWLFREAPGGEAGLPTVSRPSADRDPWLLMSHHGFSQGVREGSVTHLHNGWL